MNKIKNKYHENIQLTFFIFLFIIIRSIHFSKYLNFSLDQALFSLRSLEIFTSKSLTLIGPTLSLNFNGRHIFQSSITYYFQLIFLMLGRFDPVQSSYFFMIFCSLMTIPLYWGIKLLKNRNIALASVIIYAFLPYFINYTRFLWSPNFQLALIPGLLLIMGIYKTKKKTIYLFLISLYCALLIQFHYIFIPISLGIFFYFIINQKRKIYLTLVYLIGHLVGLSPILLFEIRNDFYNLKTGLLFVNNYQQVLASSSGKFSHEFLPFSLFFIILFLTLINRILRPLFLTAFTLILLTISISIYFKTPTNAFGMAPNWNYENEKKVYEIIRAENLNKYNIANLVYDTKANVQVYLHTKDNVKIESGNYETNKFLFVISKDANYMKDGAYEVNRFIPSQEIKSWPINNSYNLYLLQRK